jgi:demethylmenaquinone methyltransferase/2-methoxy-6-polyprenyl-1,4-benzoquinol methylase
MSMEGPGDKSEQAREMFAGIAPRYEWMGVVLSLGQDARWRRVLVSRANALPGQLALDVASGTGLVARELASGKNLRVVQLDPSEPMLRAGIPITEAAELANRVRPVLGRAEHLPFPDGRFDLVTFTYLLRYVDDPESVVAELTRVLRPGGCLAGLEFGVPSGRFARGGWWAYTRGLMPVVATLAGRSWGRAGVFLGPSIREFWERYPLAEQVRWWQAAGLRHVRSRALSLGAGIVMWGVKGGPRVRKE